MSFSNKFVLKDWNYKTPITDILNLEENNLGHKKNCLQRKMCVEGLGYGTYRRWEKRREFKNNELPNFQQQKLKENHETTQRLTSQLQKMQEQMNSMNGSGDFQDVESN